VVAYTIVVEVDGKYALLRWIFGLFCALFRLGTHANFAATHRQRRQEQSQLAPSRV
jgi:hypothetical protein